MNLLYVCSMKRRKPPSPPPVEARASKSLCVSTSGSVLAPVRLGRRGMALRRRLAYAPHDDCLYAQQAIVSTVEDPADVKAWVRPAAKMWAQARMNSVSGLSARVFFSSCAVQEHNQILNTFATPRPVASRSAAMFTTALCARCKECAALRGTSWRFEVSLEAPWLRLRVLKAGECSGAVRERPQRAPGRAPLTVEEFSSRLMLFNSTLSLI